MVKNHSDSEREKTHCRHMGYPFQLAARVLLYASSHRQDNTYQDLWYTSPVMEHWLEREIAQWVHHEGSIQQPITSSVNALTLEVFSGMVYGHYIDFILINN